ncbi:glutamyl-tRNA(Gln) and/or aspartyl-tRNA(Asn) amidotransferase, B subunit [Desulfitobacterium dichloroeliminans LMG P-21439]|uniref:Aspartyl/glutamyl-tRNA(Asn/Gln) amidotransferase subunit B n=1 Tax=Desulfitobacterium dichloroeliminans (strain LMG P-21439 / DCA1) TaxID=871963 RepID=L0F2J0_DESDL|nr:Asp-tRNA(Asn)/Glu-tRNA(Gln) amidotransferase subunit GatB [Desulfitobacterium dichloroeliminans]AGA68039.1 glutamyl-tRNA(Gln) and/or aspartyl-tRNA(Asn) amidotransferase, B subunit [Desulfitobacterium dichloroeliminans LMG P-21439]
MSTYEAVIGLEVHVELKTQSKLFCGCSTEFGKEPNTQVCPVCLGLPGSAGVLNKKVVELATKAGLALNCEIGTHTWFDRKNYYYPDLPKGYQVSQVFRPIAYKGYLDIEVEDQQMRINITRAHIEEDPGKLVHSGASITTSHSSSADYNRSGIPLVEIVSEPEIRSGEEAKVYLEKLKAILEYTGVSDVKMEQGSLRCDANVSIRPVGTTTLGTKTEIKNMNSFRAVQRAIEYEVERQIAVVQDGEAIIQETRGWDENKGITLSMRNKENPDYRCFIDAELTHIKLTPEWIEGVKASLPELPDARQKRLVEEYGLPAYDAAVITSSLDLAEFFDATLDQFPDAKLISNWIMGELLRLLNAQNLELSEAKVTPDRLAKLLALIKKGTISNKIGKEVFELMFKEGKEPEQIVEEKGLVQISDEGQLTEILTEIIAKNPKSVEDFQSGKEQAIGFLVGQVMKATKGQANPGAVNGMLREMLTKK